MSKSHFFNFLETKVNPNSLLFSEREREREREGESWRSPVVREVIGWRDGAGQTFSAGASH